MKKSVVIALAAALSMGAAATAASAGGYAPQQQQFCRDGVCATTYKQHCWDEKIPVVRYDRVPTQQCRTECEKQNLNYQVQANGGVYNIPYSTCKQVQKCDTVYVERPREYTDTQRKCVTLPHCETNGQTYYNGGWRRYAAQPAAPTVDLGPIRWDDNHRHGHSGRVVNSGERWMNY